MLKEFVRAEVAAALARMGVTGAEVAVAATDKAEFGDYATNVAFTLSKALKKSPRQIGEALVSHLDAEKFAQVEVAGPGFVNVHLKPETLCGVVREALRQGEGFARVEAGRGRRAQVEFVSANPTGPLTVGHGRNAVVGDTVANLLAAAGWQVTREYYFNDAGKQMRVLGQSLLLRVRELLGEEVDFPEDHYQGQYLVDIARHTLDAHGPGVVERGWAFFKDIAKDAIFEDIQRTLAALGIRFDVYFNESDLVERGQAQAVLDRLREVGLIYERDGATWYKATQFGAEKDRVLVRASGEPTYRLPDIAYHVDKLERGFDLMVNVLGSDHAAQTPDILSAVGALGYDAKRIRPLIYQFVALTSGGQAVKMSTRKANFVTLDELVEEVGPDAVRYFMVSRSTDAQMEFDLALAKSQSKDNPVYYIQYAHTRIAGILREAPSELTPVPESPLNALGAPEEWALIKKLDAYPEALAEAAEALAPHMVANYAHQLAGLFHAWYEKHRVLGEGEAVGRARLALARAVQVVLRQALGVLGVRAPERM